MGGSGREDPAAARVAAAMRAVDRRDFLPASQQRFAHADQALRIGHGATCTQPSTVEVMLRLLDARPGHRVLDVGSGSGWTTALLARLVGPSGAVVGVEIVPELVTLGRANLLAAGLPARIEQAEPGRLGRPEDGPYDRILVSAEARRVPRRLIEQLSETGRMVVPVRGDLVVVDRLGPDPGDVRTRRYGTYSFVRLRATGED
ncbi:protein-L-isoaspartate O-methyltransferase family protein [Georgenia thermotolerans]|uniref:Protein-L-isoaspartate O-methyltransferase n=1 Tax=Georgenia thermotolerans TaxID=527326 RepID=A0A7J5UPZ1_9MICO|nr:methyltransferase domain-containing protein [Georgenia thermotolerans]KAE8764488.1 methyltransferase domain-containing protein [Georgenia thermotolerans]